MERDAASLVRVGPRTPRGPSRLESALAPDLKVKSGPGEQRGEVFGSIENEKLRVKCLAEFLCPCLRLLASRAQHVTTQLGKETLQCRNEPNTQTV